MDLFSSLDHTERERDERMSGSRARIAAKARCRQQFGRYVAKAGSDAERAARISMLEGEIRQVVESACEQFEHEDVGGVLIEAMSHLKTACAECGCDCTDGNCKCGNCSTCNKKEAAAKEAAAHPDGCGCSFPVCVKKREGADSDGDEDDDGEPSESELERKAENVGKPFWEQVSAVDDEDDDSGIYDGEGSNLRKCPKCDDGGMAKGKCLSCGHQARTAAPAVVDKDNSQKKMEDLPAADESGLGGPSPKMDKGTWKGLDPIDIGSQNHRLDRQDPTDRAPYQEGPYHDYDGAGGYEGSGVPDQPNLTQVDAQKAMESPAHGDHTEVFPDGKHQADPVTSSWRILN